MLPYPQITRRERRRARVRILSWVALAVVGAICAVLVPIAMMK